MTVTEMRDALDQIARLVENGQYDAIPQVIAEAKTHLAMDRYVTTTEAKELLGIGSVNTIKEMVTSGEIRGAVKRGNRTLIPLTEIERVQETEAVRMMHPPPSAPMRG